MSSFGCDNNLAEIEELNEVCGVTEDEFVCQSLKLLAPGSLYQSLDGCNSVEFFKSIAATYFAQFERICALIPESSPCSAVDLLQEWATFLVPECQELPTDVAALQALLCDTLTDREVLTCTEISQFLTDAGYVVLNCGMDETLATTTSVTTCGASLGFMSLGACPGSRTDDPCERAYRGLPCTEACCAGTETPTVAAPDPCDVVVVNPASCSSGTCDFQGGLGTFEQSETFTGLANPGCLVVTVDVNSPAIDPCDLNGLGDGYSLGVGMSLGFNCAANINAGLLDSICTVQTRLPAHINLKLEVAC